MPRSVEKGTYTGTGRRRRRVMDKFVLDEISFVDRPAQEPALMAIMKGASVEDLMNDDRWKNVEKVLIRPRSGETRSQFVSRFMSNGMAEEEFPDRQQRLAVANSQFDRVTRSADKIEKRFAVLTMVGGHQHIIDLMGPEGIKSRGHTSFDMAEGDMESHSHEWVRRDDGSIVILMAAGHIHEVAEMIMLPMEAEMIASADFVGKKGGKEKQMPTEKTAEELSAEIEKLTKQLDDLQSENSVYKAEAVFSDAERDYYKGLDDEAKKAFRETTPEVRLAQIKKRDDEDPVIFKSADGTEYRKSDDSRLIELAKREDARETEFRKMQEEREEARIEKYVGENLQHHPGEMGVRVAIVKAVEGIADEKVREGALDALKAKDAKFAPAFQQVGVKGQPDLNKFADGASDRQEAQQELRKRANEIVEKDTTGKLNFYDAYEKACRADTALYAQARGV